MQIPITCSKDFQHTYTPIDYSNAFPSITSPLPMPGGNGILHLLPLSRANIYLQKASTLTPHPPRRTRSFAPPPPYLPRLYHDEPIHLYTPAPHKISFAQQELQESPGSAHSKECSLASPSPSRLKIWVFCNYSKRGEALRYKVVAHIALE